MQNFLKIALKNQIPTSHRLHNDFSADTLFRKEENTTHQTTSIQRETSYVEKTFQRLPNKQISMNTKKI